MLNQLHFKRDDFQDVIIRYYSIMIERNNVINVLYEIKKMIE